MLGILLGAADDAPEIPPGAILVADEILPSAFHRLDLSRIAGIVTARGGSTSHAAILAAARGVPMIVGCGPAVLDLARDTPLLIDFDIPQVLVDPDEAQRLAFHDRRQRQQAIDEGQRHAAATPCRMSDGTRIEVFANCGSLEDTRQAVQRGAEGCGLLRTEFLFLGREEAPGVDQQAEAYAAVAAALDGRPLIVRTLDAGSDKPLTYLPLAAEENPALGLRGIRLSLAMPGLLEDQFRAILKGVPAGQCRIMLPMVSDLAELRAARERLRAVEAHLGITAPSPLGIMVETPAAAVMAAALAREADFLSIGSNDLAQYALAADRQNTAFAGTADALHPAVLRLMAMTAEAARAHDRWVGLCGAIASEPKAAVLLAGLGIGELSVAPAMVPAVKAALRHAGMPQAEALAANALLQEDAAGVRHIIEEHWHANGL